MITADEWVPRSLQVIDLRHQKNGQIKLQTAYERGRPTDHVANVMARCWRAGPGEQGSTVASEDAPRWAQLFAGSTAMLTTLRELVRRHEGRAAALGADVCRCEDCAAAKTAIAAAEGRS